MSRSDTALTVSRPSSADALAERPTYARARADGGPVFLHPRTGTLTGFINGVCKILLTLAVVGIVLIGGVFAVDQLDLAAEASSTASVPIAQDHSLELTQLRAEVALLTEQSLELRSELVMLTGQGGVLPKLVARLQEQRRINAAHANALRQLYGTTDLISASLPTFEESAANENLRSRPVQVTPVTRPKEETPKRVVLIPESGDPETAADNTTGGGN